jgi:HK97 family phage prohead protease
MTKSNPVPEGAAEEARVASKIVTTPLPPISKKKVALLALAAGAGLAGMLTRNVPDGHGDPQERRQPQVNGRGTRDLSLTPESYDATARTVEAILSAGTAVRRYYFTEELEISQEAIDVSRVAGGICPLLDTHNQYELNAVIGRILAVRIEKGQLIGVLQFADTEAGRAVEARVAAGELRAISIGYRVTKWQITATDENDHETWRAVAWELLEASLVPVPADPNAVVRSAQGSQQHGTTEEEEDMRRNLPGGAAAAVPAATPAPTAAPAPAAPAARAEPAVTGVSPTIPASRILERCGRAAELDGNFQRDMIARSEAGTLTEADFERAISDRLIESRAQPHIDVRAGRSGTDDDDYRRAVSVAVQLRADPSARFEQGDVDIAREFRGMTLMELARDFLQRTGISTAGMGRLDVAGAALGLRYGALTTSDFANALSNAAARRVRASYEAAPQTFGPIVSRGTLPDFKDTSIVGLGDAPQLLLVRENAEFTYGALTDSGLSYRLQTYGRIVPITRQAIINDDKQLFGRIPTMFGRRAADLESDLVWGTLISNVTLGDGNAMFTTGRGNLAASGGAINVTTVGAGRQAMRGYTNNDGNLAPSRAVTLIVGAAKETEAQQFLTAVTATQTSNVNPFPGTLRLIVEDRITGNQWFLAADPDATDMIELSHLDGQESLYIETQAGFDVDGIKTKARLDVGAAPLDWGGFYKNPGN